jgi:hypothetical protein
MALLSSTPVQPLLWGYAPLAGVFNSVFAFVGGKWTKLWRQYIGLMCACEAARNIFTTWHFTFSPQISRSSAMGKLLYTALLEHGGRQFLRSVYQTTRRHNAGNSYFHNHRRQIPKYHTVIFYAEATLHSCNLNMEATGPCEMFVNTYRTIRRPISEYNHLILTVFVEVI